MLGTEVRIKGRVQGVGFRPYVWQIAKDLALRGEVLNDGHGVLIRLASHSPIERLYQLLHDKCPPLARIDSISHGDFLWSETPQDFSIVSSEQAVMSTHIVPDAATCPECLHDIGQSTNRRFQYPFTNCTHCGPRFTIIKAMPYDRPATVMADFPLCPQCSSEYQHPADRRFHAQPVACQQCGPTVWVTDNQGNRLQGDWIELAEQAIRAGQTVAIKSVGGFHLACDATNDHAIALLRARKQRPNKPFAVMVKALSLACELATVSAAERAELCSAAAPIVLLAKCSPSKLSALAAPNLSEIGVMLPSNPLQHLLLNRLERPLVMTSANGSGLPPALTNQQALCELTELADLFMMHDRDIVQRCDDSLVRLRAGRHKETLRRARGYVPNPLTLPNDFPSAKGVIAYGGDLKSAFAIGLDNEVVLSQYLGDLTNVGTQQQYQHALAHFELLYQITPYHHVADCHTGYFSHQLAAKRATRLITVPHHHAHVAACLLENGWQRGQGKVMALTLDGIGVNEDGELWGGELLIADYLGYQKVGGLPAVALPGGDRAAKEPWRVLYAHIRAAFDDLSVLPLSSWFDGKNYQLIDTAINRAINSPLASSTGRLFDAVAASLGICFEQIEYEGQAACQLESLALQCVEYPDKTHLEIQVEGCQIDLTSFWRDWFQLNFQASAKAYLFHQALAAALAKIVNNCARVHKLETLVLSGGVFHNVLLTRLLKSCLDSSIRVLQHRDYSYGDASLALGQLAIAINANDFRSY